MRQEPKSSRYQPVATASDIAEEWSAALADAELDPNSVALWTFADKSSSGGLNALYYAPNMTANDIHDDPSLTSIHNALDEPGNRGRDRFCIWTGVPAALVAARMRHELEHARQCREHGAALWSFAELVGEVLAAVVGDAPGGAALYNATPIELDASAAAARHVRERYGDALVRGLLESDYVTTDGPNLRPQLDPGPIETLPTRTLAFLWLFPRACEAFEHRSGTPIAAALEAVWTGAEDIWSRLDALEPGR